MATKKVGTVLDTFTGRVRKNVINQLERQYFEGASRAAKESGSGIPTYDSPDTEVYRGERDKILDKLDIFQNALETNLKNQIDGQPTEERQAILRTALDTPITVELNPGKTYNISPREYVKMLARTIPPKFQNLGYADEAGTYGAVYYFWRAHDNCCAVCASKNGRVFKFSDGIPPDDSHPNCLLPNMRVLPIGGAVCYTRAYYRGLAIDILTRSGNRISVTPNHPILTNDGFVPARFIEKGDYIVGCSDFKGKFLGNKYYDKDVPVISDIVESALKAGMMSSARVPVSSKDFHGDGKSIDDYIDIIWSNGLLSGATESAFDYPFKQNILGSGLSELLNLPGSRTFAKLIETAFSPIYGRVRGSSHLSAIIRTILAKPPGRVITASPDEVTFGNKPISYGTAGAFEAFRKSIDGTAILIKLDQIIDIKVRSYHGYVYDMQSISSFLSCNSIVVSNCHCYPEAIYPR